MVAPEAPGGRSVREVVLHDMAHGQGDDAMRVAAARRSQVREVGAEVKPTELTTVPRVDDMDLARTVPREVTDVVKDAVPLVVAVTATPAARTGPSTIVAGTPLHQGRRQIFDTSDPLSAIGDILSRFHDRPSRSPLGIQKSRSKPTTGVKISRFLCYSLETLHFHLTGYTTAASARSRLA
jgi:hypothetical protein